MGTDKRARQKANRQAKIAEREVEVTRETREVSTKKWGRIAAIVAGVVALFVLYSVLTGGGEPEASGSFVPPVDADVTPTAIPEVILADSIPDDFLPFEGQGALAAVKPAARADAYFSPPPMIIDPAGTYSAVLNTTVGPIRLNLFADETPMTVNNFVALARDGFYDGVSFHRVLDSFMAQGGDPTGTGTGGPGYMFGDEVNTGRVFDKRGQLAMANAGPGTNGSQFFITFEDEVNGPPTHLNNKHTIFGEIADDSPALDAIPVTGEGDVVIIESVGIFES